MDSVTQAVLGASITGCALGRFHGRKAVVAGAVLATLPDLDVFMRYVDPITSMTSHRGFSHSLWVLTAASVLLTVLWRWLRPTAEYGWSRLFIAIWLALITHPLLDAFTSYGTQLMWPLTPVPQSWASIFIIDPVYTVPLIVATVIGVIAGKRRITTTACAWALGLSTSYLLATLGVQYWVDQRARQQLAEQQITVTRSFTTPQTFSQLLWRSVLRTDDGRDCEVITGLFDKLPGEQLCIAHNHHLAQAVNPTPELDRLRWFNDDWVRFDVYDDLLVVSDLRMGIGGGNYSFRFVVAEQDYDGHWLPVTPYRWSSPVDFSLLPTILRRSLHDEPVLPLQDWANEKGLTTDPYRYQPK